MNKVTIAKVLFCIAAVMIFLCVAITIYETPLPIAFKIGLSGFLVMGIAVFISTDAD